MAMNDQSHMNCINTIFFEKKKNICVTNDRIQIFDFTPVVIIISVCFWVGMHTHVRALIIEQVPVFNSDRVTQRLVFNFYDDHLQYTDSVCMMN